MGKPILFSGEMVRAILDGRKTQTRRVVKPQPVPWVNRVDYVGGDDLPWAFLGDNGAHAGFDKCPYGQPGDLLWVRETFLIKPNGDAFYRADDPTASGWNSGSATTKWRPSIFMPRWASRITLRVLDMRVERVQEITEADALAEGIEDIDCPTSARYRFVQLWDFINAKRGYSWNSNPWVWVVSFEVVK